MKGTNIQKARKTAGLTQRQLGALCKVTETTVANYENDRRKPEGEYLERLFKALPALK